jgi:hypothetical protein
MCGRTNARTMSWRRVRAARSPTRRARSALEWSNDLGGDPTAIKVTFLEAHLLAVDLAGFHVTRVQCHAGTQGLKTQGWFWVGPPGPGSDGSAGDDVKIVRYSLEFAEAGALNRDEYTGRERVQWQVVDRGMTRLKYAHYIGGIGNHLPAKPNDDPFRSRLDPWRTGVVPHRFLTGFGADGLGRPKVAGKTLSRSHTLILPSSAGMPL